MSKTPAIYDFAAIGQAAAAKPEPAPSGGDALILARFNRWLELQRFVDIGDGAGDVVPSSMAAAEEAKNEIACIPASGAMGLAIKTYLALDGDTGETVGLFNTAFESMVAEDEFVLELCRFAPVLEPLCQVLLARPSGEEDEEGEENEDEAAAPPGQPIAAGGISEERAALDGEDQDREILRLVGQWALGYWGCNDPELSDEALADKWMNVALEAEDKIVEAPSSPVAAAARRFLLAEFRELDRHDPEEYIADCERFERAIAAETRSSEVGDADPIFALIAAEKLAWERFTTAQAALCADILERTKRLCEESGVEEIEKAAKLLEMAASDATDALRETIPTTRLRAPSRDRTRKLRLTCRAEIIKGPWPRVQR